jgi:hypothetical protein
MAAASIRESENLDEEALKHKCTVVNRHQACACAVALCLKCTLLSTKLACTIPLQAPVYTDMNAVSKVVSRGVYDNIDKKRETEIEALPELALSRHLRPSYPLFSFRLRTMAREGERA